MAVGKLDLAREIARRTGKTQADILEVIDNLPHVIRDLAIESEDEKGNRIVNIPGFIKVELKWNDPRVGRNPRTGDPVDIAGKWTLMAKSLDSYKNSVSVRDDDAEDEEEESAE